MRLLLAEDEIELANALSAILKHNGYDTDVANDGALALEKATVSDYDAVILDVMMPKLDGLEVLSKMRSAGNSTPVIILTAKSELDDKVAGLDAGADDYLTKPFAAKELLARIRAVTRRDKEMKGTSLLSFGNTTLNLETYRISASLGEITLINKEFQIFEALMRSAGKILPQSELMKKIWDDSADQNVLWVYISYIRKKLEKIGSNTLIKAHRNAGYSLETEKL